MPIIIPIKIKCNPKEGEDGPFVYRTYYFNPENIGGFFEAEGKTTIMVGESDYITNIPWTKKEKLFKKLNMQVNTFASLPICTN